MEKKDGWKTGRGLEKARKELTGSENLVKGPKDDTNVRDDSEEGARGSNAKWRSETRRTKITREQETVRREGEGRCRRWCVTTSRMERACGDLPNATVNKHDRI